MKDLAGIADCELLRSLHIISIVITTIIFIISSMIIATSISICIISCILIIIINIRSKAHVRVTHGSDTQSQPAPLDP